MKPYPQGFPIHQSPHGTESIVDNARTSVLSMDGTLEHPWGLTPKANQAREMARHDIRVPQIFDSLESGIDWLESQGAGNGAGLYLRSEHPYDGKLNARSGILTSIRIRFVKQLDKNGAPAFWSSHIGLCESKDEVIRALKSWMDEEIQRSNGLGYDPSKTSFTFWEEIPGDNYTVVRDKNVDGVYFIHPINTLGDESAAYRIQIDGAGSVDGTIKKLIALYNQVGETARFGIAPIVEIQMKYLQGENNDGKWREDEPYFLQALTTSPGEISNWKLEREMEEGEFEAPFVRGVTPPEGTVVNIRIIEPGFYGDSGEEDVTNNTSIGGSMVDGYGESSRNASGNFAPEVEALVSENADQIFILGLDMGAEAQEYIYRYGILNLAIHHTGISMIHKPKMSLVVDRRHFYTYSGIDYKFRFDREGNQKGRATARLRIVSDGRRAYIKILD